MNNEHWKHTPTTTTSSSYAFSEKILLLLPQVQVCKSEIVLLALENDSFFETCLEKPLSNIYSGK
jgi:hypothetical protein